MSLVAHAMEFVVLAGALCLCALAAALLVGRGYVRRRWRSARGHVAVRGVLGALALLSAGRAHLGSRATPEGLSRGSAPRVRRRLWVAVEDAEAAVAHAGSRDAPVAELPSVCRSLRSAAVDLDGLLQLERRLPPGDPRTAGVRGQVAEVIGAARDVQAVALRAGGDATEPQVRALVRQARDEVDIVTAGLSRLRSVAQPR